MDVEFEDSELDRLETDTRYRAGFGPDIVRGFRKALQSIRAAQDLSDLYAIRGLRLEKLKGKRSDQYSVRINDQWRLILKLDDGNKVIIILAIVDYH